MFSTIKDSSKVATELRPLSADEIDFVAGGQLSITPSPRGGITVTGTVGSVTVNGAAYATYWGAYGANFSITGLPQGRTLSGSLALSGFGRPSTP